MPRRVWMPILLVTLLSACGSQGPTMKSMPAKVPTGAPVRVADHCSMTTLNSLIVQDGSAPAAPAAPNGPVPAPGAGGALPADFVPVQVFSCDTVEQSVPGDGLWQVATQRTAPSANVAALVAAYRTTTASVLTGDKVGCTMELDADPAIAFVDAHGTAIWPAAPRDPMCSHILPAVTKAIAAVPWTVVASQRTTQVQTAGGCSHGGKDGLADIDPGPSASGPYFARTPSRIAVCLYQGDGTLIGENDLTGTTLAKALAVLDAAPPETGTCTAKASQFATFFADGDRLESFLEVDGCRRVGRINSWQGEQLGARQLDAAGVAAIVGAQS